MATHNSYNASAYSNRGCYWDPNQKYSLRNQLRMGVREFELDVHKYFSMKGWPWNWKTKLLLSHAQNNHTGASAFDREFSDGLAEFESWLREPQNSNEVIIIDIEDHMDGENNWAADIIESYLGDLVYRPKHPCEGIPRDLTLSEVLDEGKQVIFVSRGCKTSQWNALVYAGTVDHHNGYPESNPENLTSYPDCASSKFSRADYDKYLIHFFEDRTNLSAMFGDPGDPIEADTVSTMVKCGVNIISMDQLKPYDGRLNRTIWSWDTGEPNNANNEDCAVHKSNGRLNDIACGNTYHFACKNEATSDWYITDGSGDWTQGESLCSSESNGEFVFSVPENGYDNEKLKEEKTNSGIQKVWINYNDRDSEGEWGTDSSVASDTTDASDDATEEGETFEASADSGGCASTAHASTLTVRGGEAPLFPGLMSLIMMTLIPFSLIQLKRHFIK